MQKKYMIIILIAVLFIVTTVLLLQSNNANLRFEKNGGFVRKYITNSYKLVNVNRPVNGFIKYCGTDKNGNYFLEVNTSRIFHISRDGLSVGLKDISLNTGVTIENFKCKILGDTLYLFDNMKSSSKTYILTKPPMLLDSSKYKGFIVESEVIDGNTTIIRSSIRNTSYMGLYKYEKNKLLDSNLKLFNGGITLASDGFLQPYKNKMYFISRYTNKVASLDSNLKLQYYVNTIDTVTSFPELANLSKGRITYKKQPVYVNRASMAYEDKIYICSAVLADNDRNNLSKNKFILDVYDPSMKFKYEFSLLFSLPSEVGAYPSSFSISNKNLQVFFADGHIITYER